MCVEWSELNSIASFPGLFLLVSGMSLPFQCMMTNYMHKGALQPSLYPRQEEDVLFPHTTQEQDWSFMQPASSCIDMIATYTPVTCFYVKPFVFGDIVVTPSSYPHNTGSLLFPHKSRLSFQVNTKNWETTHAQVMCTKCSLQYLEYLEVRQHPGHMWQSWVEIEHYFCCIFQSCCCI